MPHSGEDVAVTGIAALTDPAKLAILKTKRAANPRVLKCIYWLHEARSRGLEPKAVVAAAQAINHSEGPRAALILDAHVAHLENEIANLDLLARTLNRRLGMKITERELSHAVKLREAALITEQEFQLIQSRVQ